MARMSTSGTGNRSRYFDTGNYDDSDSYVSAADAAFQTVMKKLKSFKPYLLKRLEIIKRSGKQFAESDTIEDIEHWLEIMNNARADTEYGMDTLNEEVHDILEHMRENPLMEACYDDVEDEMDAADQRPEPRNSNVIIDVETNREQPRSEKKLNDSNGKIDVDEYSITSTIEPLPVCQPGGTVPEVVPNPHGPAVPDPAVAEGALDGAVYQRSSRPPPMEAHSKDIATNPSSKGLGRGVRRVQDEATNSDRDPGGTRYDSTGAPLPSVEEEQLESSRNSIYDDHNLYGNQASPLDPQDYHAAIDGNDLNYIHGMEMRPNFMGGYPPPMYAPQAGMWNFQYCQPYPSMPQHIMQQPFPYPMPAFGNGRRPHRGNSNRARGNRPIPRCQPPEGDLPPCNEQDFSRLDSEDGVVDNHEVPPASSDMGSNDLSAAAVAKRAQEYFARQRQQSNFNNRGAQFPKSQSRGVFRRPFHRNTNAPRNGRQPVSNPGNVSNTHSNEASTTDIPEADQPMDTLGPGEEETSANKVPAPPRIGRDPTQKPEAKRLSEQEAANRFRMNQAVNESEISPGKVQELKKKLAKQGFHKLGSKRPDFVEAEEINVDLPSSVSPDKPNKTPKKQTPPSSAKKRGRSRSLGPPTPKKPVTPGKSKTPSKSPRAKATSKSPRVKTPAKSPKISMNFPGVSSRRPTVVYSSDSEDSDSEGPSGPTRRRTRAKSMSQSPRDAPAENVHPMEPIPTPTPKDMSDEDVYQFLVKMDFDPVQIQKMMSDPLGYQGLKDTIFAALTNNTNTDHIDTPGGPGTEADESNTRLAELDSNAHSLDRTNTKRNTTGGKVGTYGQQLAEIEDGGSDVVSDNDVYMPPKKRKYGSSSRPGNDIPEPTKRRHISRAASVISDFSGVAGDGSDSDDDGGSVISCASDVRAKMAAKFKSNLSSTKSPFTSMEGYVPPQLTANATLGKVKIEQDFIVVQTIKEEVDLP